MSEGTIQQLSNKTQTTLLMSMVLLKLPLLIVIVITVK